MKYEGEDMILVLKHFFRLLKDISAYSWVNGVWWPVPFALILIAIGILGATTQMAAPYIYTIF